MLNPTPGKRSARRPLALLAAACIAAGTGALAGEFSRANTLLFMTDHLVDLPQDAVLPYHFTRTSTLSDGFEDDIILRLTGATADGARNAEIDYFTGPRKRYVPAFDSVRGNPVLSLFLQRDINEMARRTGGPARHFQARIKLSLEESAVIEDTIISLGGREVRGVKITVDPFRDDPQRGRYEKFANKTYEFILSSEVPGHVFRVRSHLLDAGGKEMIREDLEFRGGA